MNFTYILTQSNVVAAMQVHGRGSRFALIVLAFICMVLILLGMFSAYRAIGFGGAIGGLLGYFAILNFVVPVNAKKQYQQNRALRLETSVSLTEQAISFRSEAGDSYVKWPDIHFWKQGRGVFLLYITDGLFHIISSKSVPDEGALIDFLNQYIGPKKT